MFCHVHVGQAARRFTDLTCDQVATMIMKAGGTASPSFAASTWDLSPRNRKRCRGSYNAVAEVTGLSLALTHLDTPWRILTDLDASWHTLTHLDRSWRILTHLDASWQILTNRDRSWQILPDLGRSWQILTDLDRSWHILTDFDTSWQGVTHLNRSCHILTERDTSWHIWTHLDTSWGTNNIKQPWRARVASFLSGTGFWKASTAYRSSACGAASAGRGTTGI